MKNNEILYIALAIVGIVIIGGGVWWYAQSGNGVNPLNMQKNNSNGTNTLDSSSYEAVRASYGDKRIQFNEACELTPNNATFKSGTTIMLDNRSSNTIPILLDGVEYNISASGYMVVTLVNTTLPHTILVDCGKGKNSGQILLEK